MLLIPWLSCVKGIEVWIVFLDVILVVMSWIESGLYFHCYPALKQRMVNLRYKIPYWNEDQWVVK